MDAGYILCDVCTPHFLLFGRCSIKPILSSIMPKVQKFCRLAVHEESSDHSFISFRFDLLLHVAVLHAIFLSYFNTSLNAF